MTKTKMILVVSFLLAFAAGTSLGMLMNRPKPAAPHRARLADQLNLTADQQARMEKIWSSSIAMRSTHRQQRGALASQRDQAVTALFPDALHTQYEAIQQDYARKMDEQRAALAAQREQAILALLPEAQRVQYESAQQEYSRKTEQLSQEMRRAVDEAVKGTKEILTPDQAAKYEQLQKDHRDRGMGGGFPGLRGPRGRRARPPDQR